MKKKNGMSEPKRNAREGGTGGLCRVREGGTDTDGGAVYVAVYGTLMRGERNERWREGIETVTEGMMVGVLYDTGWGFPNFVPRERSRAVRCEVLKTDAAGVAHMDVLEGYPDLYDRAKVSVAGDDGRLYDAIVYTMVDSRRSPNEKVIARNDGGLADWRKYRAGRS